MTRAATSPGGGCKPSGVSVKRAWHEEPLGWSATVVQERPPTRSYPMLNGAQRRRRTSPHQPGQVALGDIPRTRALFAPEPYALMEGARMRTYRDVLRYTKLRIAPPKCIAVHDVGAE